MNHAPHPAPNYLWSLLTMRCPRCRRGDMFLKKNAYSSLRLSRILGMPEKCAVCKQRFDLEPGFWYGTGFISYGLAVLLSAITFIIWFLVVGVSWHDNRVFWWLGANAVFLVLIQPWLMRISRVIYLYIFVKYDPHFDETEGVEFQHH